MPLAGGNSTTSVRPNSQAQAKPSVICFARCAFVEKRPHQVQPSNPGRAFEIQLRATLREELPQLRGARAQTVVDGGFTDRRPVIQQRLQQWNPHASRQRVDARRHHAESRRSAIPYMPASALTSAPVCNSISAIARC